MYSLFTNYLKFYWSKDRFKLDSESLGFLSKFHNLEGDLIGERKKNFSILLRNTVFSNEDQLNLTLENLHPESYQQSLFRIDALIYFRKTLSLVQTLKEGNEVFISKILKQSWFFEEAFKDITTDEFVNEFLPCVSYVVRLKLLRKICKCWNEDKMDELFDSVNKRYGLYIAIQICHTCTSRKIEEILAEHEIRLCPRQVVHIYDRSEQLFMKYLGYLQNRMDEQCLGVYGDQKVLKHIAKHNLELLLNLEENNQVRVLMTSKNISGKIMDLIKIKISLDIERYMEMLHHRILVRKFGNDFKTIYRRLFSKKFRQFDSSENHFKLLLHYPVNERWALYVSTFFEVFPDKKIEELLGMIDDSILQLNPDTEIVQKWAEIHHNKTKNDDMLIYFDTTKCFLLIKKRIEVTSNKDNRFTLVKILLQNCSRYNDLDILEKVLEYICVRHRNEDAIFRLNVLEAINNHICLDELNEKHWNHIYEQIKILRIKKFLYIGEWLNVMEVYMKFLAINNYDLKDPLKEFINYKFQVGLEMFYFDANNGSVGRKIMVEMWKVLPEIHVNDQEERRYYQAEVIRGIIHFSLQYPAYFFKLSDFPDIVDIVQNSLEKIDNLDEKDLTIIEYVVQYNLMFPENAVYVEETKVLELVLQITEQQNTIHYFKNSIKMLMKKCRSSIENKILHLYFEKLYYSYPPTNEVALWFLKNEPRTVLPYLETILNVSNNCWMYVDDSIIRQFKQYSHLGFDRKLSDFYKEMLNKNKDVKLWRKEGHVLTKLSILLSTEEFIIYGNEYFIAKSDQLGLNDEDTRQMLKLQCEVAKILHQVIEPTKMLPLLIDVCRGDYLKQASKALYSLFYRSIENELYFYTDLLYKEGVHVGKHALYLGCEVLQQKYVIRSFKTSNYKLYFQRYLFSAALKRFLKNPSEELFSYIKSNLLMIITPEAENICMRNLRIPVNYRIQYIKKLWGLFKNSKQIRVKFEDYSKYISIDIFHSLPFPLIEDLIIWNFTLQDKKILPKLMHFIIRLLQYSETDSTCCFKIVFENLSKLKKSYHEYFFQHFLQETCREPTKKIIVDKFTKYWKKYFLMLNYFKEHIALGLLVRYLDSYTTETFAENVVLYLEQLSGEFGNLVFDLFEKQLKEVIDNIHRFDQCNFFDNILKYRCSIETCILVLNLMDYDIVKQRNEDLDKIYFDIIEKIKKMKEPIVQIHLRKHLLISEHINKYPDC